VHGPDPIVAFDRLLAAARQAGVALPEAMALATVDDAGVPSLRHVLLKSADATGFSFYTNLGSRKARALHAVSRAALCFLWRELEVQVSVEGDVVAVPDAEADAYWQTRPRESQLAAWASRQSSPIDDRAVLLAAYEDARLRFAAGDVPRPAFWSGFRVRPSRIEFWHGAAHRLHDRFCYTRELAGGEDWVVTRLSP
jgi:pyridoxamine 5'-phosphate oxidase